MLAKKVWVEHALFNASTYEAINIKDKIMETSQANHRKHTRIPTDLKFFLFIDSRKYSGKISNISLGGAFLSEADPEISPTHNSHSGVLKIYLGDELLLLKCDVVYAVTHDNEFFPAGAGVAFDEEDNETNKSIIKLGLAYNLC